MSTARNWWLRSPNPSNANNARNVNTSGALNNNNANNANGVGADCVDSEHKVRRTARNQSAIHKERLTFSRNGGIRAGDAHGLRAGALSAPDGTDGRF